MEQQIAPTLWLPPGMCVLNSVPTMQLHPTSPHLTSQLLKQQQLITHTLPTTNMFQGQQLLQHGGHILQSPAHNIIHIPGVAFENLILPPAGKQTFEMQPPAAPLIELPFPPLSLQLEKQATIPGATPVITSDPTFQRHIMTSKVTKKKRISPSAKRRSRLRLIAFLESKRKQQMEQNSSDENTTLQTSDDGTSIYPDNSTSPPSSDDVTLSPGSTT